MSLQTMKNKITNNYMGVSISGRAPGGIWVTQGPFRNNAKTVINTNNNGFSLNGGHRNIGRVGQTWLFSKNFTPYRGAYARGNGGCCGTYYQREQVFPSREVDTRGNEYLYIKPSSLSTDGMLEKKYMWINNGQYPNNWVQPDDNANLTDNHSQWLYIQQKAAANDCVTNTNDSEKYETFNNYNNLNESNSIFPDYIFYPLIIILLIIIIYKRCKKD